MPNVVSIIGSRDFPSLLLVDKYIDQLPPGTAIVTGGWWDGGQVTPTRGVDRAAAISARRRGLIVILVPADGDRHGRSAGMVRNPTIIQLGESVLAFWDGESPGTKAGLKLAYQYGRPTRIVDPDGKLRQLEIGQLKLL